MKWLLAAALLFIVPWSIYLAHVVPNAHRTTHEIRLDGAVKCSSTAIGPHALLTAAHCMKDAVQLAIDGKAVTILKVINDGHDHSIVIVGTTFYWIARFGSPVGQGDRVFYFGNPGPFDDLYRDGPMIGHIKGTVASPETATLYDINVFSGDSGAAIFDHWGRLVGVVSFGIFEADELPLKLMGSFSLHFSDKDYAEAFAR